VHAIQAYGKFELQLHSLFILCTDEMSAVSLTPQSLYLKGEKLRFPRYRRLGGLQNRSVRFREQTNLFPLPEKQKTILPFCIL
jgi:predicted DNA-binding transcriptional regulator AlpA